MSAFSPRHLWRAGLYSWQGLVHAVKSEQAVRHIMLVWLALLIVLAVFRNTPTLITALAWPLVLVCEFINTAIERLCDLVSPDYNLLVKQAKDLASAATAVAVALNLALWLWLFIVFSGVF